MSFTFRPAKRENVPLLLGMAGGTGSGKTFSALRIARGLAGDAPFCGIDTEAGRMKHYADEFKFDHGDLSAPFTPARYTEAILAADAAKYPVIIVDSMSHEHAGDGGLLDMQEAEYKRLGSREATKMLSWAMPKMEHKAMLSKLLQIRAHLILCFRAEEKIELVKGQHGMEVRKKVSATGLDGWTPISEKSLPYELTASFLLLASNPGVPLPIKLEKQHRNMIDLRKPLDESMGRLFREWAQGGTAAEKILGPQSTPLPPANLDSDYQRQEWLKKIDVVAEAIQLESAAKMLLWRKHCGDTPRKFATPSSLERLHKELSAMKEST